jgi:multidrug resistance protein, MATE family
MARHSTTGAQARLDGFRFDAQIARRILQVSLPLMGSMVGNLVMLLVDRICLARYSSETLAASGPATFTAQTFIAVFTAIAGFSRPCVAQAFGRAGGAAAAQEGALGVLVGVACATLLFLAAPVIELIPFVSGRPAAIKLLESQFLFWAAQFGSVMTLNMALSAYFSGIGRTRITLIAGLLGQGVTIFMTIGLVFGKYSLPQLGMRGSALGTLAGTLVILGVYLLYMPREVWRALGQLLRQRQHATWTALGSRLRQGFPLGTYAGAETLGNTAFIWIVASLGAMALAANNINVALNYVAVVPLVGLGVGCSVLCGNAIGANEYSRIYRIIFVTLCIEMLYIVPVSSVEIITPGLLLDLFGLHDKPGEIQRVATATSHVLWCYSVAFAFSMTGAAVLQSFGLTKFPFITRVTIMWGLSIPTVYFVASSHVGSADFLPGCWIIGALFEGLIGAVYFWRIRIAVKHRQNNIVFPAGNATVESPGTT